MFDLGSNITEIKTKISRRFLCIFWKYVARGFFHHFIRSEISMGYHFFPGYVILYFHHLFCMYLGITQRKNVKKDFQ